MGRDKRIWFLSPMRAAKVQASLRIRAVSSEPLLLAHISSESRGTFRQKARSLAPLSGWACAVKICHDGMLEDTNSLDAAHTEHNKQLYMSVRSCTRFSGFLGEVWASDGADFLDAEGYFQNISNIHHMPIYGAFVLHGLIDLAECYHLPVIKGTNYMSAALAFAW